MEGEGQFYKNGTPWRSRGSEEGSSRRTTFLFLFFLFLFFFFFFFFFWPHPQHMEVPRFPAAGLYQSHSNTRTEPSLRPTPRLVVMSQSRFLNPLSKARDQICSLMVPSWICLCCAMTGNPSTFQLSV